jgi:hypothetical protein
LLLSLSGARAEVLDQCPSERVKFESLGWALLITSGMAVVSMWFALASALGVNGFLAFFPAVAWGFVIMGIDRWLITSLPLDAARRRLAMALPRLLLALLLGTLISTPFVLRIFNSEITAQMVVMKQERAAAFLTQQANSQVGKQVTYWRNNVANLQKVIVSRGVVSLDPAADPQVQSLTKQRTAELALQQQYYKAWQCQLYGGSGCPAGQGPLAKASQQNYENAKAQVAQLTTQIQQRETQLSATDKASQVARLTQAQNALPAAQAQLATAVARENALQQSFDIDNQHTNGLLIRLQALDQLSASNSTVNSARILLFLLFLVIECLPVSVKLLQQPGVYERILQAEKERELGDARQRYRRRRSAAGGASWQSGHPPASAGGQAGRSALDEIWHPSRTAVMPGGDLPDAEDRTPTIDVPPAHATFPGYGPPATRRGSRQTSQTRRDDAADRSMTPQSSRSGRVDTGELTAVDQALRGMDDGRAKGTPDTGTVSGIRLDYHDDDL